MILETIARFTRYARDNPSIDRRSGVSARFSIAAAETVAAAALHRATVTGEETAVARIVDLESVVEVLRGKIEFESGEEGRELEILDHLMRKSKADAVRAHLGGVDLASLVTALEEGDPVVTGDRVTAAAFLASIPDVPVLDEIATRLDADTEGKRANAIELALEGLYLTRRIDKEADESGQTVYG